MIPLIHTQRCQFWGLTRAIYGLLGLFFRPVPEPETVPEPWMFAHHASVLVMCPRSLCPPHCSVKTKPPTPNGLQTPRPPTPVSSSSPYLPPVSALSLTHLDSAWTRPSPGSSPHPVQCETLHCLTPFLCILCIPAQYVIFDRAYEKTKVWWPPPPTVKEGPPRMELFTEQFGGQKVYIYIHI